MRFWTIGLVLLLASCATYHVDSKRNGVFARTSVGKVTNLTDEGELGGLMRRQLQEQFGTVPGIEKNARETWLELEVTVRQINNHGLVSTKVRDRKSRDEKGAAYQTVLFRIGLVVEYKLIDLSEDSKVVLSGTVVGQADQPLISDMNITRKQAYLQAANDASRKIKEILVDANLNR